MPQVSTKHCERTIMSKVKLQCAILLFATLLYCHRSEAQMEYAVSYANCFSEIPNPRVGSYPDGGDNEGDAANFICQVLTYGGRNVCDPHPELLTPIDNICPENYRNQVNPANPGEVTCVETPARVAHPGDPNYDHSTAPNYSDLCEQIFFDQILVNRVFGQGDAERWTRPDQIFTIDQTVGDQCALGTIFVFFEAPSPAIPSASNAQNFAIVVGVSMANGHVADVQLEARDYHDDAHVMNNVTLSSYFTEYGINAGADRFWTHFAIFNPMYSNATDMFASPSEQSTSIGGGK